MLIRKRNFTPAFVRYPIVVDKDTVFEDCNFMQVSPHTVIFDVRAGVKTTFRTGCNLTNVTTPDNAVLEDVNTFQGTLGVKVASGRTINVPCTCEKCASWLAAVRIAINNGSYDKPIEQGGLGRRGDLVKVLAAARRVDPLQTAVEDTRDGTLYVNAAAAITANVAPKDQKAVSGGAVADRAALRAENLARIAFFGGIVTEGGEGAMADAGEAGGVIAAPAAPAAPVGMWATVRSWFGYNA